jgi:hypothetical protein
MANIDFSELSIIKEKMKVINSSSNIIHITINSKRKSVKNAVSKILSIHDKFICIESKINDYTEKFTINYIDIIIGTFTIKELLI